MAFDRQEHTMAKFAQRSALLLVGLACSTMVCAADDTIGRVIASSGDITAINNGSKRVLHRGSLIQQGDKLSTGNNSSSQLRMVDNALIAIRPDSQINFDNYQYSPDTNSGISLLSLLKGGFRTITGLIGQNHKNNYSVKTSVATIGIRGTHYGLTLCQANDCASNSGDDGDYADGLYGSVVDGEITAANTSGEYAFGNDESFYVPNANTAPVNLLKPPAIIFGKMQQLRHNKQAELQQARLHKAATERFRVAALLQNMLENKAGYLRTFTKAIYEASNDDANGINLTVLPDTDAPADSTVMLSYFLNFGQDNIPLVNALIDDGSVSNQIKLTLFVDDQGELQTAFVSKATGNDQLQGTVLGIQAADRGVDNIGTVRVADVAVGWGRWDSNYQLTDSGTALTTVGKLHYIYASAVTPQATLASLNVSKTYSSVAGTMPTDLAGNQANTYASALLNADFGAGTFDYAIATTVNGISYSASTTLLSSLPGALGGVPVLLNETTNLNPITNAVNTGNGLATLNFVGNEAQGAISSFTISNSSVQFPNPDQVSGAVLLLDQSIINNNIISGTGL
jgi:hypothetical protein